MNKQKYARAYTKEVGNDEGLLTAVIGSTATVDRYGEIIDQESWDLKHYKKNPVILWAHNLTFGEDRPPIGKAMKVKVVEGNLQFDIQFDMADPFAADIFRKYKEGFLNAFSVGFIPHRVERVDDEAQPNLRAVLKDNELLELSAVPVPANPEALNTLRARSFKTKTWDKLMKEVESEDNDEDDDEPGDDNPTPPVKPAESVPPTDTKPEDTEAKKYVGKTAAEIVEMLIKEADPTQLKTISDVVSKAKKPDEDKGGSDSDPKTPKLGGGMARVMREATKLLQDGLAEYNATHRK